MRRRARNRPGGGLRRRAPLAVYRPRVDLPGTGRIGFECVVAYDAAARGRGHGRVNQLDARRGPDAARAAVLLHQAVEDARPEDLAAGPALPRLYWAFRPERPPAFEPWFGPGEWTAAEVRIGAFRAWPAEMLVRPPGQRYEVHPVDGSPDPWMAGDVRDATAGADEVRGRWLRRGGASIPLAQEPAAIYASLDHLRGRSVRNPAYAALRGAGLIPGDVAHREWVEPMGRDPSGGSGDASPAVVALRARVEAHAASSPAAEAGLLAAVRAGCEAAGVAVTCDGEGALQFLAGLVMSPWGRVEVPDAGAVQVLRLGGPPGASTLSFSGDVADLDLNDLGGRGGLYEPLPPDSVRGALRAGRSPYSTRAHHPTVR